MQGAQTNEEEHDELGTHIRGQPPVDVVMFNSQRQYEAAKHQGDDVVHVRPETYGRAHQGAQEDEKEVGDKLRLEWVCAAQAWPCDG